MIYFTHKYIFKLYRYFVIFRRPENTITIIDNGAIFLIDRQQQKFEILNCMGGAAAAAAIGSQTHDYEKYVFPLFFSFFHREVFEIIYQLNGK